MKKFIATVIIVTSMLVACAGTPFNWSDARRLRVGMTEQQVTAIMGPPYSVVTSGNGVRWIWSYANGFGGSRALAVTFKDGKLVKVPDLPESFQ